MKDIEGLVTNVKVDLLRKYAFFGHIISQLPVVYVTDENNKGIGTLAVGKENVKEIQTKLFINKDYLNCLWEKHGLSKIQSHLMEVMKHEIYHLIFRHLTIELPDKFRLNMACECAVNSYIDRNSLIDEKGDGKPGVFPIDFKLENKLGVHEYYRQLESNEKYKSMPKPKKIKIVLSDGSEGETEESVSLDSHELWEIVKEDPIAEEMLKDIIRQAVDVCKKTGKWGDVPGELKSEIAMAFEHKKAAIPWQVILKQFIASSSENILDYTMKRRSKRYGTRPGTKKEDVLNLAIGIDTSGSVNDNMINLFFNELQWITKSNSVITIFEIDTEIRREYSFNEWDGCVEGRGGTNLEPLVKEVSERKYDALIFFTDMETPTFKEEYNIPCMWVINNSWYKRVSEMPYQEGIFLKLSDDGENFELVPE